MKKNTILRTILQYVSAAFVYFAVKVLFIYLWDGYVNVLKELIGTAVFCVFFFPILSYLKRKKKADAAEDPSNKEA